MDLSPNSRSLRRFGAVVCLAAAAGLFFGIQTARANIVAGNFVESLNFYPTACSNARVLEALGRAVGAGIELGETDEIANPCDYNDSILVDLNPLTNTLTLTPSGSNDYQVIDIQITNLNLGGQVVTNFTPISDNLIDSSSAPFTRTIGFGPNSLSVHYDVNNKTFPAGGSLDFSTGSAVFQVQLGAAAAAAPVPALGPLQLGLLAILVVGVALVVAKRRGVF